MIPKSLAIPKTQFVIDTPGQWLVLGDCHMPHHDDATVKLAVDEAKRLKVSGILLNGDLLDSGEISFHEKHASCPKYADELAMGNEFLKHLRSAFPKARIIYKEGNHEERLDRYVIARAPALGGVPGLDLPSFLKMNDLGVEWVSDCRIIRLGKLSVIHGHEYRGAGGVSPARWLYLKAGDCALCGHFHRTSEHHSKRITGYQPATWSVGCACYMNPEWLPENEWNHGFATVEMSKDGSFEVRNRRIIGGKIV